MATENLGLTEIEYEGSAYIVPVDENFRIIDKAIGELKKNAENTGDMNASDYDGDGDGVVDDSDKLGGQTPEYYAAQAELEALKNRTSELENKTEVVAVANGGTGASTAAAARSNLGAAPAYSYGTADLTAGSSALTTGKLHFVYE